MSGSESRKPSLRFGRQMVAIPGPSIMPDRVLEAFSRPMPDLYDGPIVEHYHEVKERLPAIARTQGEPFVIIGNGHAAWQMATSNTLTRGAHVLVVESGRFAQVWGRYTGLSDVKIETLAGTMHDPIDPAQVEQRLRDDVGHEIEAVLVVHVDTASSVRNDIAALRRAMDAAGHPALLMVDCIASLGCDVFEMDEWGVDITVAACQKGLMVPPGMSFVWASDKALAAHDRAGERVGYFDWELRRDDSSHYFFYAGTPPLAHLRALSVAFDLIDEEGGIEAVWHRHQVLADAVRACVAEWESDGAVSFNITDPAHRSNCVTTVLGGSVDADAVRATCDQQAGLVVGLGIGDVAGMRIAHMGHLNPPMLLGALGTIESALIANGATLTGSGVGAAAKLLGGHL